MVRGLGRIGDRGSAVGWNLRVIMRQGARESYQGCPETSRKGRTVCGFMLYTLDWSTRQLCPISLRHETALLLESLGLAISIASFQVPHRVYSNSDVPDERTFYWVRSWASIRPELSGAKGFGGLEHAVIYIAFSSGILPPAFLRPIFKPRTLVKRRPRGHPVHVYSPQVSPVCSGETSAKSARASSSILR